MKNQDEALPGFLLPYHVEMRFKRPLFNTMKRVRCAEESNDLLREVIGNLCLDYKEFFWVMFLTRSNHVISIIRISEGSDGGVIVSTKQIAQVALMSHASAVIAIHNHPSGRLEPSGEDLVLTKDVKKGLALFDIELLDHLIISTENYYSFADEGNL